MYYLKPSIKILKLSTDTIILAGTGTPGTNNKQGDPGTHLSKTLDVYDDMAPDSLYTGKSLWDD